jgi:hypothetical protein
MSGVLTSSSSLLNGSEESDLLLDASMPVVPWPAETGDIATAESFLFSFHIVFTGDEMSNPALQIRYSNLSRNDIFL